MKQNNISIKDCSMIYSSLKLISIPMLEPYTFFKATWCSTNYDVLKKGWRVRNQLTSIMRAIVSATRHSVSLHRSQKIEKFLLRIWLISRAKKTIKGNTMCAFTKTTVILGAIRYSHSNPFQSKTATQIVLLGKTNVINKMIKLISKSKSDPSLHLTSPWISS